MECCDVDNKQYSKVISLLLPEVYNCAFIYYCFIIIIQNKICSTYCNTIQMLNSRPYSRGGNMRQSNY